MVCERVCAPWVVHFVSDSFHTAPLNLFGNEIVHLMLRHSSCPTPDFSTHVEPAQKDTPIRFLAVSEATCVTIDLTKAPWLCITLSAESDADPASRRFPKLWGYPQIIHLHPYTNFYKWFFHDPKPSISGRKSLYPASLSWLLLGIPWADHKRSSSAHVPTAIWRRTKRPGSGHRAKIYPDAFGFIWFIWFKPDIFVW